MQVNLPLWLDYLETHIGFVLPKTSHQWLVNAIRQTAETHDMTVGALFVAIRADEALKQALIDTITITESRFFRDEPAIEWIGELYQQHLTKNALQPFSVVSLGCSTGQELWSIGMVCEKIFLQHHKVPLSTARSYRLLGLDINQKNLSIARQAHYANRLLGEIDEKFYDVLEDVPTELGVQWQPKQAIQNNADFASCNLFDQNDLNDVLTAMNMKPAVVICQNVLIYFRRFDQRDILGRTAAVIADGGYLILGAAEGLFWQDARMTKVLHTSVNAWQKHGGSSLDIQSVASI